MTDQVLTQAKMTEQVLTQANMAEQVLVQFNNTCLERDLSQNDEINRKTRSSEDLVRSSEI